MTDQPPPPTERASQTTLAARAASRVVQFLRGSAVRRAMARSEAATEVASRLDEAATVWTTHLETVRAQVNAATEQLIAGFAQILTELDAIVDPNAGTASANRSASGLDQRTAVLEQCEARLRGLVAGFSGFMRSRDEVVGAVRSLAGASGNLGGMAEDVSKLARQTNLLSINAAIEAARAGPNGRGFAVVAAEVRRLSTESGDTGRRIGEQVNTFGENMRLALQQATENSAHDAHAIRESEQTINEVVRSVDGAVSQLNQRADELSARGASVRAQIEQLTVAFQFQDRVQQIVDHLNASVLAGVACLRDALETGDPPAADEWRALLSADYTTREERAVFAAPRPAAAGQLAAPVRAEVEFF